MGTVAVTAYLTGVLIAWLLVLGLGSWSLVRHHDWGTPAQRRRQDRYVLVCSGFMLFFTVVFFSRRQWGFGAFHAVMLAINLAMWRQGIAKARSVR